MATTRNDAKEIGIISWSRLAHATAADASLSHILQLTSRNTPYCKPSTIHPV